MGRIFCLMGKSASGKDTIYRHLLQMEELGLNNIVLYTTRPIRKKEENGVQYHFVSIEEMESLRASGRIIESRSYDTAHGLWHYFMVDDGSINLAGEDYIIIGTIESCRAMREYYGEDRIVPIYIELDDGSRLQRALKRELKQPEPKYVEMCRRFIADTADFSDERLEEAGIVNRFVNEDLDFCIRNVVGLINGYKSK